MPFEALLDARDTGSRLFLRLNPRRGRGGIRRLALPWPFLSTLGEGPEFGRENRMLRSLSELLTRWLSRRSSTQSECRALVVQHGGFATSSSIDKRVGLYHAIRFALPQKRIITAIVALTLIISVLNAIEPLVIKSIFDELAARQAGVLASSIVALGVLAFCARRSMAPRTGSPGVRASACNMRCWKRP